MESTIGKGHHTLLMAVLNTGKRLARKAGRVAFSCWVEQSRPSVVLVQEPWVAGNPQPFAPDGYVALGGNDRVQAWARTAIGATVAEVLDPCALCVVAAGWALVNVYLDHSKPSARAKQLGTLREILASKDHEVTIVAGDFNLAPSPADGLWRGAPSTFNNSTDRGALAEFMASAALVDLGAPPMLREFTMVQKIGMHLSEFRCDLALVSAAHASSTILVYDHSTRSGPKAFTDHSALRVTLPAAGAP